MRTAARLARMTASATVGRIVALAFVQKMLDNAESYAHARHRVPVSDPLRTLSILVEMVASALASWQMEHDIRPS